jgi:hypothetical protein
MVADRARRRRWPSSGNEATCFKRAEGVDHVEPIALFILQFVWFLFAWCLITYLVLWPWSAPLSADARLSVWVAPEMFRALGIGLLVPNVSPGMPAEFAITTAAADSLTAVLAAGAFVGLRRRWGWARGAAWACTLVGSLDALIAFPHAASTGAITHLAAQWYVPVFAGPPLVICHVVCWVLLVRGPGATTLSGQSH